MSQLSVSKFRFLYEVEALIPKRERKSIVVAALFTTLAGPPIAASVHALFSDEPASDVPRNTLDTDGLQGFANMFGSSGTVSSVDYQVNIAGPVDQPVYVKPEVIFQALNPDYKQEPTV